ncbi:translation elongation factor-like protein [Patescibacteria group bacterium]|nr:translation elongation factor-like protein [Patescibacteria group bacterium]
MGVELGKVIHWYDKISVAVVKLNAPLKKGDRIVVKRGEEEFEDTITSIQIDHKDVESAKKGDAAAVKLSQKAKEGSLVCEAG